MIREELQRNDPRNHLYVRDHDRPGIVAIIRRGAGRALVALGTRLDPTARPVVPGGEISIAGGRG
jgi:hypothetical protein